MNIRYDALVIGAGHNGLVTAAYLAKAGWKVGVVEARPVLGGCAVTEELWPGFKISRLSYVNSLFRPEIIQELDLRSHGFEMLPRSPSSFTPYPDGRSLLLGPDHQMNAREIAKFSQRDAERYHEYEKFLTEVSEIIEPMLNMVPPNPSNLSFGEMMEYGGFLWKNRGRLKRQWSDVFRLLTGSATDFLDQWFESDELKSTLATDAVIGANASPSQPGTAYVLFHHVMGECNGVRGVWGYMRGGMGGLSQSIANAARKYGAEIHLASPVERILLKNGRAAGVALRNGREFDAGIVISNADPNVTFQKLLDPQAMPDSFRAAVKRINYDTASVKINLALAELPNFKAVPGLQAGPHHRGTIHICPGMQTIEEAYSDSVAGRPSRVPILECSIPSVIDSTVAPEGKHVMNMFTQYGPYQLRNGKTWDQEKDAYAQRCIDQLSEYAPNLKSAILHMEVLTPLDMEREFHITGGNITHGRLSLDQMFNMRPVPGWSKYRTPVENLWLCGAGAHPGGGVMGAPGRNAAREILKAPKPR